MKTRATTNRSITRRDQVVNNTAADEVYVLYQCGTAPPAPGTYPANAKLLSIPLTSVVVPDTTAFAFMVRKQFCNGAPLLRLLDLAQNALGLDERVSAVSDLASSACAQRLQACNRHDIFASCKFDASSKETHRSIELAHQFIELAHQPKTSTGALTPWS